MRRFLVCFLAWCWAVSGAVALQPEPGAVFVRVVDVGAGLCCVVVLPTGQYLIYDAGNYTDGGTGAFAKIAELIPAEKSLELLVLSHSDSDHLGAVDEICAAYTVKRVLESGYPRTTTTWDTAVAAIQRERDLEHCLDLNLRLVEFPPGATYRFGEVFVTMVCGFSEPPTEWGLTELGEVRNAGSIVIRLQYQGKSILFCGDTVGRHIGDPADTCLAAEQFMVENVPVIKIDSDVMIAPHHGADNGSSTEFIRQVSPEYVIFSAGHKYEHPRRAAADRYLALGVLEAKMFRTDRGDNEGGQEWKPASLSSPADPEGDDDVDILLRQTGEVKVEYRSP
jgi:competence protein ComEC